MQWYYECNLFQRGVEVFFEDEPVPDHYGGHDGDHRDTQHHLSLVSLSIEFYTYHL